MAGNRLRSQQQDVAAIGGDGHAPLRVQQFDAVLIGSQAATLLRAQQQDVAAIGTDEGKRTVLRAQQQDVVVIAAEGVLPEQPLVVNTFDFNLDGHFYYGMHVRGQGTFVFDMTTGQWTQWQSGDLTYYNAQFHTQWGDLFYASTLSDNTLVEVDPDSVLDDSFRVNTFTATGRIESQSRRWIKNPEAQLFGSIGQRGGDVALRFSDDEGLNYSADRVVSMAAGVRDANIIFYDLGSVRAPGRIFQLEDEGTLRRIQSLRVILGDGDEQDG